MNSVVILKWVNWVALALLAFVLIFTRQVVEALGMDNTLENVMRVIAPLIILVVGIEWISRLPKK